VHERGSGRASHHAPWRNGNESTRVDIAAGTEVFANGRSNYVDAATELRTFAQAVGVGGTIQRVPTGELMAMSLSVVSAVTQDRKRIAR